MRVYDPIAHTMVALVECETRASVDGFIPTRPFGVNHWFLVKPSTGETKRIEASPLAESIIDYASAVEERAEETSDIDAASIETDTHCKALFVDGINEDLPGLVRVSPDVEYLPEGSNLFKHSRRTLFQESAAKRDGLMIDVSRMNQFGVDKTVHRLKALGYDCVGLVLAERKNPAVDLARIFGVPVKKVSVEDVKPIALSLIHRKVKNPKGRDWKSKRQIEAVKRSMLGGAYRPAKPVRPKRFERTVSQRRDGPRDPIILVSESLDREDPHQTVPGWELSPNTDWRSLSYGVVIHDGRGRILLREPTNHFGGYAYTFAKGKKDSADESPLDVAKREATEETGYSGKITGAIPGAFKGTTGTTYYYLMHGTQYSPAKMDDETANTQWATPKEAAQLIVTTPNETGKNRDLAVLKAACHVLGLPYVEPSVSPAPSSPATKAAPKPQGKAKMLFTKLMHAFRSPQTPGSDMPVSEDGSPVNRSHARELANFIMRHPQLSKRYALEVARPVALYKARNTYDRAKAPLLARHLVIAGGQLLARKKKLPGVWHQHYSEQTRNAAMTMLRDRAEHDATSRKYDALLPKKYRKGFSGYHKEDRAPDFWEQLIN